MNNDPLAIRIKSLNIIACFDMLTLQVELNPNNPNNFT